MSQLDKILEFFGIYNNPMIGVDISSSAIKILQLSGNKKSIKLENYAIEPLDENSIVEQVMKDKTSIIKTLKNVFKKSGIKSPIIITSIPNNSAVIRTIQVDADIPASELPIDIAMEAEKILPYPIEEVSIDYEIMGKNKQNPNQNDVLIVASKQENIEDIIEITEEANLDVKVIEVDSLATERAFKLVANQLDKEDHNKIIALVDIGSELTVMNIFEDMKSIYTRSQSFGGQHLQEEIKARYGLSDSEARIARSLGELPEDYIIEVLDPFKEKIAQQVSHACQYFFSASEHDHVDYIFLTGGVSTIAGLDSLIEEKLNTKTIIANPFASMEINPEVDQNKLIADSASLMTCCGLALRNINL